MQDQRQSPTKIAQDVLDSEIEAIQIARQQLGPSFDRAVQLINDCEGHIVVSGLGKSGLVGQKLSATLASTGTPSHFLHPTEAVHGDLGRIRRGDVVLLLSYSGRTEEVSSLAAILRQDDIPIISISKNVESQLGKLSDAAIGLGDIAEACQNGLAPTSTTTAMMAVGDALAVAASVLRSFSAEDFNRSHPGGTLGRTMMPVKEVIRFRVGKNIAMASREQTIQEILTSAEAFPRRCGAILIADENQKLLGLLTDGDIRRLLIEFGPATLEKTAGEVMTANPIAVTVDAPVRDAIQIIREKRVDELPVVEEDGTTFGVLDIQDLLALKLIEDQG